MKLLIPNASVLKITYFCLILFIFLSLTLIFRGGSQFYEGGAYLAYAKSIVADYDFNILNQLSDRTGWLVTQKFYHPDHHSEIQSPLLVFMYLLECILKVFKIFTVEDFYLASFASNFILIYVSAALVKEYAKEISISFSPLLFLSLVLGSACFYFVFFTSNVIEIFAMPLIAYSLLNHQKSKKQLSEVSSISYALCLAILHCCKGFYAPLILLFLISHLWRLIKNNEFKRCVFFLSSFLFVIACHMLNQYIKYGDLRSPHATLFFFFDYSLLHIVPKLFWGYFAYGKVFYVNPIFFISIVGTCFCLVRLKMNKLINTVDFVTYYLWILAMYFHTILVLGNLTEDHLPGRAALNTFIFMVIGLCYLNFRYKSFSGKWIVAIFFIGWAMFHILSFVLIDMSGDFYIYPNVVVPTGKLLQDVLVKYQTQIASNWLIYKNTYISFLLFSIFCGILYYCIRRLHILILSNAAILAFSILFFAMTICNWHFGALNIIDMKNKGVFENRVIGSGVEIYHFDYFFDYYQSLKLTIDASDKKKLENAKMDYFQLIRSQVIQSTPDFDKVLETKADDFSFWLDSPN